MIGWEQHLFNMTYYYVEGGHKTITSVSCLIRIIQSSYVVCDNCYPCSADCLHTITPAFQSHIHLTDACRLFRIPSGCSTPTVTPGDSGATHSVQFGQFSVCVKSHTVWTDPWLLHHIHTHNCFTALFPGLPGWASARRELLDFMVQGKINIGRHTDHPDARHSIRTKQCPPPPSPIFYRPDAFAATQPTMSKHWRPWLLINEFLPQLTWWSVTVYLCLDCFGLITVDWALVENSQWSDLYLHSQPVS